jgi:hypothetical protein
VDLGAEAQGGDTVHVEERARVVVREGSVEVSHGLDGSSARGRIANFWLFGGGFVADAVAGQPRRLRRCISSTCSDPSTYSGVDTQAMT